MKKIFITVMIMFMTLSAGNALAHEHHQASAAQILADSAMQSEMAEHQQMEAIDAFPNYHPLIVHFPIVLLIMAFIFQLLAFVRFRKEFGWATLILLTLGVITAWLASNTFHAETGELRGKAAIIFASHARMATFTWWFALAALAAKMVSHFFLQRKWWMELTATLLLVASAISVSIAGHHGAQLVYMQGIGPMGKYLESYRLQSKVSDSLLKKSDHLAGQEEDHHVGEIGKGPHGGTIEEADPYHMEILADGNDLVFYLLDGNAVPVDMEKVTGNVKMHYANKIDRTIDLMDMGGKFTAMGANNGQEFTAVCTITKDGKSYSASYNSNKDLPGKKK